MNSVGGQAWGLYLLNVAAILSRTDGVIVASSLKRDGDWWNEVEIERVRKLVAAAECQTSDPRQ